VPHRLDFVFGEYPLPPHHGAGQANRFIAQAGGRRNLDPSVAVVGGEAEDAPHSVKRMAGSVRSSGTSDRVQANQDVFARDESGGPIPEDGVLAILPLGLPDGARSLPGLRLVRDLAELVCPNVAGYLMALSLLRQLFGHVHFGKSAKGLDDQLALLLVRIKPALHLLQGIPSCLPSGGQLQRAGATERYHDLPIGRSRSGTNHVGLNPRGSDANTEARRVGRRVPDRVLLGLWLQTPNDRVGTTLVSWRALDWPSNQLPPRCLQRKE
jgi:hypothetical protein